MNEAYVYLWYDGNNKKFYLGVHKGSPDDNYAHSSSVMESFTMGNVPSGFRRRILATGTYEQMQKFEIECLCNRQVPINDKYYNMVIRLVRDTPDRRKKINRGIQRALSKGVKFGRKRKFTDEIIIKMNKQKNNGASVEELMKEFNVSRASVYRLLDMASHPISEEDAYMKKLGYENVSKGHYSRIKK